MKKLPRPTYVYIARCRDGSYYTGVAADVEKRLNQHNGGRGAKYTRSRRPITVIHVERCQSLSDALKRESQIKRWRRAQKEALVLNSKVGQKRKVSR